MMNNTGLNKKYQFENFVEKDGNDLAKKEALEVVKNLGLKYNPFYIVNWNKNKTKEPQKKYCNLVIPFWGTFWYEPMFSQ